MIKNCYIHIPFCKNICTYCDFCKMYYDKKFINKYLDSLEKEIKTTYRGEEIETIYIGGGTPNCLDKKELERLFSILKIFHKSKNIEFTIEGNIDYFSEEKLLLFKKNGINRISIGIESIDKDKLNYLGRSIDINKVKDTISLMRKMGFSNINVDLIYATRVEDMSILEKDLDFLLSLDVEHISTYSLIIEENTILGINQEKNINEDFDYQMYQMICSKLKNYQHYEISNFCKEGYSSIHNKCYWENKNYYGFGMGASSYIDNKRITNTRSYSKYIEGDIVKEIEEVNEKERIEYEVLLRLRLKEGISLEEFRNLYSKEFIEYYDYSKLVEEKLLQIKDNHLFIPEDKWYISNEIIVRLLGSEV